MPVISRCILFFSAIITLCPVTVYSQGETYEPSPGMNHEVTAEELRAQLLYGEALQTSPDVQTRSIPLAFALSAVVPGLGQAYNRQWIKAAVGVALEAALITGYLNARNRGRDGEEAYTEYAHQYWDPKQYADWLVDYSDWLQVGVDVSIEVPEQIDFKNPGNWTADERRIVRSFFEEIRAAEAVVYHPETGASFSHKLPYFGEQQYYELIGKYFQFAPGWVDYPSWKEGDTFTDAIDPEKSGPNNTKPNVRGRFLEYAEDHAHANDLLRRASRISALVLVNHLLAAVDAAVSAKLNNDRFSARLELGYDPAGRTVPTARIRAAF